jgi:peroxiredoxin
MLKPDTQAPALSVPLVGGGTFTLSEQTPEALTMIVVYRGLHCPVCKAYLSRLNGMVEQFEGNGATVIAVSMDPQDRAEQAVEDWGLDKLRVGYGMSEATAREWGLYLSDSIKEAELGIFPEPGFFWVRPDGRLYLIDISSMPFSRPDLDMLVDKVGMVAKYPARGTY